MKSTCFKIVKSHCPNGAEEMVRQALREISSRGGETLEVGYQISPTGEQCVGIVFETERAKDTYAALDSMPEPPGAGTTIRRNVS